MLEISNIHIPLSKLGKKPCEELLGALLEKKLHTNVSAVSVVRRSVDARKNHAIQLVFTVSFAASDEDQLLCTYPNLLKKHNVKKVHIPQAMKLSFPPVVVGAGCAGLFCTLYLAEAGLEPLLIEQGKRPNDRVRDIQQFLSTRELNLYSNIQFGCGGAGTFSDGKLGTGTKSAFHRFILKELVEAGAPKDILVDAHPHVGSDLLPGITEKLLQKIESLGASVLTEQKLVDIQIQNGSITHIVTKDAFGKQARIALSSLFLATGHSARDTYEMLHAKRVLLQQKPFAVGYRIEHKQADVNRDIWRNEANNSLLGPASYKVVAHVSNKRSVYSFCMCPGGSVVAATSEYEAVVTNGASESKRAMDTANAALLVNINPEDLDNHDVFSGIALQRAAEKRAYVRAGSDYSAPAQLVGDYLQNVPSKGPGTVFPTYPLGVSWGSLDGLYPSFVDEALRSALSKLSKRFGFFANKDAVLSGPETRSSSPVRIVRDDFFCALGLANFYPIGEGAGYAGGIMSAATDGLRAAESFCAKSAEQTQCGH